MAEEKQNKPEASSSSMQRNIIFAVALLAVFLLGFVPMWLKARECSGTLEKAKGRISLLQIETTLASAAIDARRGDYEPARQAASQFFTTATKEIDRGKTSIFSPTQKEGVQRLLGRRDQIITLLARSDPASADHLSDLYAVYRKVMANAGGS